MPGMAAWDGTILTEKAEIGEPHCNIDYFKASNDWPEYSRNGREFCVQPMRWRKWACKPLHCCIVECTAAGVDMAIQAVQRMQCRRDPGFLQHTTKKNLQFKGESCHGSKRSKEHLAIVL